MLSLLRRLLHPRWHTHVRHADACGATVRETEYAAHLATCRSCREERAALIALATAARTIPPIQPPVGAWEKIAARLDAGGSVVPAAPTRTTRARTVLPHVSAALAAATLVIVLFWPSQEGIHAAKSELRAEPRAGTRAIDLRYTNPARCPTCTSLVVRARWRMAGDLRLSEEVPTVAAGTLTTEGTVMTGTIAAPAGALVGFVSLESTDGTWTDDNGTRTWMVMPSTPPGLALEAQRAAILDVLDRDWEGALRMSRDLVATFPDSVTAWSDLIDRERRLPQDSALLARNLAVLTRLDSLARRANDTTGTVAARMFRLAWGVYDAAVTSDTSQLPPLMRYWLGRVHEAPRTTAAVRELRHIVELQALYDRPAESLRHLETLWAEDSSHYFLFSVGVQSARRVSDTAALIRWYERLANLRPNVDDVVAARLAQFAPSRREAIARLRRLVRSDRQDDQWRVLGESREAFRRRQVVRGGQVQYALAEALLAAGDQRGGDEALLAAAAAGWNTTVFEALATRMLRRGDTVRALQAVGLLSADPTRSREDLRRLLARVGTFRDTAVVQRWRDSGAVMLRAHLLDRVRPVSLAGPLTTLTQSDGRSLLLTASARPQLVSFWSPGCAPSIADLTELAAVHTALEARGLTLHVVSRDVYRRGFDDAAVERLPFAADETGAVHRALRQWMTPERFLILPERGGVWRVALDVSELPLLAAAVQQGLLASP